MYRAERVALLVIRSMLLFTLIGLIQSTTAVHQVGKRGQKQQTFLEKKKGSIFFLLCEPVGLSVESRNIEPVVVICWTPFVPIGEGLVHYADCSPQVMIDILLPSSV